MLIAYHNTLVAGTIITIDCMVKVTGILGTASEVLYKEKYMRIKINPAQTMKCTDFKHPVFWTQRCECVMGTISLCGSLWDSLHQQPDLLSQVSCTNIIMEELLALTSTIQNWQHYFWLNLHMGVLL